MVKIDPPGTREEPVGRGNAGAFEPVNDPLGPAPIGELEALPARMGESRYLSLEVLIEVGEKGERVRRIELGEAFDDPVKVHVRPAGGFGVEAQLEGDAH